MKTGNQESSQCFGTLAKMHLASLRATYKLIHTQSFMKIYQNTKFSKINTLWHMSRLCTGVVQGATVRVTERKIHTVNTQFDVQTCPVYLNTWYDTNSPVQSRPCNASGILNGTFRRVLFLFSDRCLLRTLPHKENNGKEDCSCSCFTIIRSKAKQENTNVTYTKQASARQRRVAFVSTVQ